MKVCFFTNILILNQHTSDTLENLQSGIAQSWLPPVLGLDSHIPKLKLTAEFIQLLQNARLENSNMDPEDIDHLHNSPISILEILDDKHFVKAMKVFLLTMNSSEATYKGVCATVMECYPEDPFFPINRFNIVLKALVVFCPFCMTRALIHVQLLLVCLAN